ncbi:MAG TPA: AAA family ATPase [Pirellulaceae bacterium]|nr:AAA family ATPase [Pirellulaceae bacterium]HMO92278.1 AAA family ATPase [Pirellulaceae bacterium]HMP70096.1 AAA family ATPase [Pirellulaceae bacterium]
MDLANHAFDIRQLLESTAYPHEATSVQIVETHISWVLLTGEFAYKLKKQIRFEFIDYSSIQKRRQYCHDEVSLNRRFAPELYLGVVPVIRKGDGTLYVDADHFDDLRGSKSTANAHVLAKPEIVEYAVKMKQFAQEQIVSAKINDSQLTPTVVAQFGSSIAKFHQSVETSPPLASAEMVDHFANALRENFSTLEKPFGQSDWHLPLRDLRRWAENELSRSKELMFDRHARGMVRRCHGDLHLKNIVLLDGRLVAFDGIEFNEDFQWIDIVNEVAFTLMDFAARGRADLGWTFLDAWLGQIGVDDGLRLLRLFVVYRALVRAKVTWLNPGNHPENRVQENLTSYIHSSGAPWDKYLKIASTFAFDIRAKLAITHGFSGSGKSTLALRWLQRHGGVRLRSDVERMRINHISHLDRYSPQGKRLVYDRLLELAREVVDAGLPVIVDATFLQADDRLRFQHLAAEMGVGYEIVHAEAPFEELRRRIENRQADPSEATVSVLESQIRSHDPLRSDERKFLHNVLQGDFQ